MAGGRWHTDILTYQLNRPRGIFSYNSQTKISYILLERVIETKFQYLCLNTFFGTGTYVYEFI